MELNYNQLKADGLTERDIEKLENFVPERKWKSTIRQIKAHKTWYATPAKERAQKEFEYREKAGEPGVIFILPTNKPERLTIHKKPYTLSDAEQYDQVCFVPFNGVMAQNKWAIRLLMKGARFTHIVKEPAIHKHLAATSQQGDSLYGFGSNIDLIKRNIAEASALEIKDAKIAELEAKLAAVEPKKRTSNERRENP